MIAVLTLILGLLIGYWAKDVSTRLKAIQAERREAREYGRAGIVKPEVSRVTKQAPIDLSSASGVVRRPTQDEITLDHIKDRDRRLKDAHS